MAETDETLGEVPDEVAAMFDLTQKKKKKKKKVTEEIVELETTTENNKDQTAASPTEVISNIGVFELDPPSYSYGQLLNRVVDFVHQNNPELTDKKRFTMKPPQLMRGKAFRLTS